MNFYFRYCKMFFSFSRLVPALYLTSSKQKLCPVYWCSEMKNQPENMQRLPVVLSYGLIICCDSFTEVWLYITPLTLCCICAFVALANALVYWYVFVVHFFVHVLADFYILIICMFPCFYHLFAYMLPFICCFLLFYCLYFLLLFYPSNHCLQLILIRVMGEWPIPTTIGQEGGYTLDGSPIWVLCVAGLTERQTESPKQNFIVIYCYHLYWQLVVCIFASFSCFFVLIYLMSILPLFTRWSTCNLRL